MLPVPTPKESLDASTKARIKKIQLAVRHLEQSLATTNHLSFLQQNDMDSVIGQLANLASLHGLTIKWESTNKSESD